MDSKKNIAFVRLDILENWRFWNQYAKTKDYEAAGKEVIEQANALLEEDYTNARAAKLLTEGKEFQQKKREAGKKGGLARVENARAAKENQQTNQPTQTTKNNINNQRKKPPTKEQVYNFATDHKLDSEDARTWYEQNYVERPGCDKDGEVIRNWQGALINACKAAKDKR